jgi:hypothetical protein
LLLRELCARHGLLDRMPRYVAPGPLAANKRIAERLFLRTYDLELEEAQDYSIWAYRKAAWAVDEWPESIAAKLPITFSKMGMNCPCSAPAVVGRCALTTEKKSDKLRVDGA